MIHRSASALFYRLWRLRIRIDQALAGLGLFAAALLSSPVRADICFSGSTAIGGPSVSCARSSVSGFDNANQPISSLKIIPDTITAGTASSSTVGASGALQGTAAASASPGLLSAFASSQAGSGTNTGAFIDARATATFNDEGTVGSTSGATGTVVIPFTYQLTFFKFWWRWPWAEWVTIGGRQSPEHFDEWHLFFDTERGTDDRLLRKSRYCCGREPRNSSVGCRLQSYFAYFHRCTRRLHVLSGHNYS
ncbi:MAG: hypothetical protein QOD48_2404 [Gaiellaceae bacterium]|nr:hypothetical protein [Gaiellaceae bacterium]